MVVADDETTELAGLSRAQAVVTLQPELLPALWTRGQIRAHVLGGGVLRMSDWPPLEVEKARRTIGLPPQQRVLALTGSLDAPERMVLLGLAHRRLAGVGLLVVGLGAADATVAALTVAARPSSPILHIPSLDREARRMALAAADVAVVLSEGLGEDAWAAAAMGRRLVALEQPDLQYLADLYPGDAFVYPSTSTSEGLHASMRRALEGPPPSSEAVLAARFSLDRRPALEQLEEVLQRCASLC